MNQEQNTQLQDQDYRYSNDDTLNTVMKQRELVLQDTSSHQSDLFQKEEKQLSTINPKRFCKIWMSIREIIKDARENLKSLTITMQDDQVEIMATSGKILAIMQTTIESNINKTFALDLKGNAFDEFTKFIEAVHAGIKNKENTQINQLLILTLEEKIANCSVYEYSLFEEKPIISLNIKLLKEEQIIQYKKLIQQPNIDMIPNTVIFDLELTKQIASSLKKINKESSAKVMRLGRTNIIVPYIQNEDIKCYYLLMDMKGDVCEDDFWFEGI